MAGNSGGGAGAGKVAVPEQAQRLTNIATKIMKGAGPIRNEVMSQMLEALQTGGVNARIPLIQRSVEASNQAGAQALRGTQENLARGGLAGTPFGNRIEAQQRQSTALNASRIGPGIAAGLMAGAPAFATAQQGQAGQFLAQGGTFQQSADLANQAAWISFMKDIKSSIMYWQGGGGNPAPNPQPAPAPAPAPAPSGAPADNTYPSAPGTNTWSSYLPGTTDYNYRWRIGSYYRPGT